jgi:tetraacyldisaccharide-1-P 4'-kinase
VTPPLGDLKASRDLLMDATDSLIVVSETPDPSCPGAFSRPARIARSTLLRAVGPDGAPVALSELEREPFGLLLGIARPERVTRSLSKRGLFPRATVRFADHLLPTPRELQMAEKAARTERLRAWLCTAKCRTRLPPAVSGVPVLVLDHRVEVPAAELHVFAT